MKKDSRKDKDQVQIQYKAQCDIYQTFLFSFFQNFSVTLRLREGKGKAKMLETMLETMLEDRTLRARNWHARNKSSKKD